MSKQLTNFEAKLITQSQTLGRPLTEDEFNTVWNGLSHQELVEIFAVRLEEALKTLESKRGDK